MPILHLIQDEKRQLTKADFQDVANYLEIPESDVFGVSTYYSMYSHKKLGEHVIFFCDNLACMILEAESLIKHLGDKFGMKVGETTEDGKFSLFTAECLGACGGAPAMLVDGVLYENVDEKKLDEVVEGLK
ncbi:MAG: NADH-quinone oxidoreductase subunit NuoE family protein [Planctomycetota bacterium]|jgi:NADH-quinone oxidoreductase subunit E